MSMQRLHQKRTVIFCVILSLVFLSLSSCKQKTYWTYRDNETGLEISFPEGWSKVTNYPDTDATLAKKGLRKIEVANIKDSMTGRRTYLIMLIGRMWEKLPVLPYVRRESHHILIDGIAGEKETSVYKVDNKIVGIRIYLKREDTYFTIAFSAQAEQDWELFDDIAATLKFR